MARLLGGIVRLGVKGSSTESDLRRSHVLATEHQSAELNSDLGVVEGRGNQSYID